MHHAPFWSLCFSSLDQLPSGPGEGWPLTTHFCERFVWYANIKNHGKITLRTSRNWFLSIFSLTQGESKNWRSSRRSRTSATKKILQQIWGSWKSRTSATKKILKNMRKLKVENIGHQEDLTKCEEVESHLLGWCPGFHLHHRKRSSCAHRSLASQNQGISSWRVKRIPSEGNCLD